MYKKEIRILVVLGLIALLGFILVSYWTFSFYETKKYFIELFILGILLMAIGFLGMVYRGIKFINSEQKLIVEGKQKPKASSMTDEEWIATDDNEVD
ncbi:MAG TPA: hypothetical protein PLK76_02505 [bacterium]|nr:hypothetical protein [bacterium]